MDQVFFILIILLILFHYIHLCFAPLLQLLCTFEIIIRNKWMVDVGIVWQLFFKEHGKRECPCYQIQFWTKIKHALDVHHNEKKMKEWRRKQPQKSKKGCCLEENKGTNLYLPKGESHKNTRVGRRSRLGTNFLENIATRKKMNFPLHTSFYTPSPNN